MKSQQTQTKIPNKPCILFSGGGTSGHINPAIAIARELQARRPDIHIIFTGTAKGMEADIVPRYGFEFLPITASPFKRKLSWALVKAFFSLYKGRHESLQLIDDLKPLAVVGTGGYVAGPILAAAGKRGVPYLIHEQNAFPGQSNRVMSKKADTVCISYTEAKPYFERAKKVVLTGNPIDQAYFELTRSEARATLGIPEDELHILVSGGSLGARTLNQTVINYLKANPLFPGKVKLVSGKSQFAEVSSAAAGIPSEQLDVLDYLYDMPLHMAAADIYICRAGAGTCAEVAALGKPSIMVPYPYATGDHQTHNAKAFSEIGGALLCRNEDFTEEKLAELLGQLDTPEKREAMAEKASSLAKPRAAADIVDELMQIIAQR